MKPKYTDSGGKMDKRDKNFIIDDALNLVSSYLHSVMESELEKKGMKRKLQLLV